MTDTTINPEEIAKFAAMADEWWDPRGKFKPLHKFNPVRLGYVRDKAIAHFGKDGSVRRPLEGLSILDIGCGGGLLSEPLEPGTRGARRWGSMPAKRTCASPSFPPPSPGSRSTIAPRPPSALAASGEDLRHRAQHGSGGACRQQCRST